MKDKELRKRIEEMVSTWAPGLVMETDIYNFTKEYALSVLPEEKKVKYGRFGAMPFRYKEDQEDPSVIFHYGEDAGYNLPIQQAKKNINKK